jgi:hypothetical protein
VNPVDLKGRVAVATGGALDIGRACAGRFPDVGEAAAPVAWPASEECPSSTGAGFDPSGRRAAS